MTSDGMLSRMSQFTRKPTENLFLGKRGILMALVLRHSAHIASGQKSPVLRGAARLYSGKVHLVSEGRPHGLAPKSVGPCFHVLHSTLPRYRKLDGCDHIASRGKPCKA